MAMYERATLPVENTYSFQTVAQTIERALSAANSAKFLAKVKSKGLRVRDFAAVLEKDLLGRDTRLQYEGLGDSDRGQIREMYLSKVEQVPAEVRTKFFKVYAYY